MYYDISQLNYIKTVELQMVKNIRTMPNAAGVVETPFVFVPCLSEKREKMSHLGLNEYQQKQQQKKKTSVKSSEQSGQLHYFIFWQQ